MSRSYRVLRPSEYCEQVLRERPYRKQAEVMDSVLRSSRVVVAAANAVGKSWAAARLAVWFAFNFPGALVVTTAPTYRQVRYVIWREIHNVYRKLRALYGEAGFGKPCQTSWSIRDRLIVGFSAAEYALDRFQGLHAANLLVIADEASGISWNIYEQIEATLRGRNACLFMIGNPLTRDGPFYAAFQGDAFLKLKLTAFDSPNVTGEAVEEIPGLVTKADIERDRKLFGEDSDYWRVRILAEFPAQEESGLFTIFDLEKAAEITERDTGKPVEAGVDPARGGGSLTVCVLRQGKCAFRMEVYDIANLMEIAEKLDRLFREEGVSMAKVDAGGLGAGLVDRLRQLAKGDYEVIGVTGVGAARGKSSVANLRTEMWLSLLEKVRTGKAGGPVFRDGRVVRDLMMPRIEVTKTGKISLTSKAKMETSPDFGDAVVLAFWDAWGEGLDLAEGEEIELVDLGVPGYSRWGKVTPSFARIFQRGF